MNGIQTDVSPTVDAVYLGIRAPVQDMHPSRAVTDVQPPSRLVDDDLAGLDAQRQALLNLPRSRIDRDKSVVGCAGNEQLCLPLIDDQVRQRPFEHRQEGPHRPVCRVQGRADVYGDYLGRGEPVALRGQGEEARSVVGEDHAPDIVEGIATVGTGRRSNQLAALDVEHVQTNAAADVQSSMWPI